MYSTGDTNMFSKLAYSTLALTVSLGTVMSCQAEATG
ncbi:alpha/beta hydrolase, partial [Enterobacter sp. BT1268]|nr:alpha/beta hydrolase [Enterobacter sp. BT1268]